MYVGLQIWGLITLTLIWLSESSGTFLKFGTSLKVPSNSIQETTIYLEVWEFLAVKFLAPSDLHKETIDKNS